MERRTADYAKAIQAFCPAVFDCSRAWFNQINQSLRAGLPGPKLPEAWLRQTAAWLSFKADALRKI
jgi:hypothetical protein